MSGTGKRGPDRLNMIGVVTVGVCGAVLTYVSIVLLTAYYMNDTSQLERQNAVEAAGSTRESVKARTTNNLDGVTTGTIPITRAMQLIVTDAAKDPSTLVPGVGPSTAPTVVAMYGRPVDLAPAAAPAAPATTPPATTPPATTPAEAPATGSGSAAGSATGSAATPPATAPVSPTPAEKPGSGTGTGTGTGTGSSGSAGSGSNAP